MTDGTMSTFIEEEEELDSNEELIAHGGVRDPATLEVRGFAPVWISGIGYPGEIPDDIADFLDSEGRSSIYPLYRACYMIGQTR
jgi:hypothetical protein